MIYDNVTNQLILYGGSSGVAGAYYSGSQRDLQFHVEFFVDSNLLSILT